MTINKYDITLRRHLEIIQNSNQYPRFLVLTLFPRYCTRKLRKAKLSHKILFEDK